MQFSLQVICNCNIIETVKQRVTALTNHLCVYDDYSFSPYWKDEKCVICELNTKIENPDYSEIRRYIQFISGAENLVQSCLSDGWECAYFATLDELLSDTETVFVVCNIF